MSSSFTATQVVNERPPPRVLVYYADFSIDFSWVSSRAETFRMIESLDDEDLAEWDLLVTDLDLVESSRSDFFGHTGSLTVPDNLNTFRVQDTELSHDRLVDIAHRENDRKITGTVRWKTLVPGRRSRRVNELPEALQDLVQGSLLPAIEKRDFQEGILPCSDEDLLPTITQFRPFLVGPGDLAYGASYRRMGGSRHWVIPSDAGDLGEWLDCAISEWHLEAPHIYPSAGAWQTSAEWMTAAELDAQSQLEATQSELQARIAELDVLRAASEASLVSLRKAGDVGRRRLVTAKDFELQDEVLSTLGRLGFDVEDMDPKWKEREHREDFRIKDPAQSDWFVLADATGSAKGAKMGKLMALQKHATKFVIEESRSAPPELWLFINHLLHRDPVTRGPLFTDSDAEAIEYADALAIDTTALFVLVRDYAETEEQRRAVRTWMRSQKGQLTLADATEWLDQQNSTSPG